MKNGETNRGAMKNKLCQKLFAKTDLLRIYAEPFTCNIGSRRVLEKAGFQLEGILRSNAVKNGQVLDMAIYALVRKRCESWLVCLYAI